MSRTIRLDIETVDILFFRAALRRVSNLEETFGQGEPPLDYRGLVRRAEQVVTRESDSRWLDIERYSNRQQTGMLIGGLQGELVYEGDLAEFLPLLRYCEVTHLGKQTAFGLGRVEVEKTVGSGQEGGVLEP